MSEPGPGHPPLGDLHPRRAPARGGNEQLKRALFLSAFAALADPPRGPTTTANAPAGKRHNAALICLARRRVDVLFAMLRDGTLYQPHAPKDTELAA